MKQKHKSTARRNIYLFELLIMTTVFLAAVVLIAVTLAPSG